MPLFRQYEMGGAEVTVWKITETLDELLALVSKECATACLENFSSEKRRFEWLAVRVMVSHLFGQDARVAYDAAGKPVLKGMDVHISISHTNGYAAIACSRDSEIGLDIELSSRNVLAVAGRFMQRELLEGKSVDVANRVALCHWCAKEALFKITGDLGGNFKDNIYVGYAGNEEPDSFPVEVVGLEYKGSFVADCRFDDGLLLVLCHG
ncbi:MAG: siderophore biosynthesis protein [Bacteroidaceae bacterium]|nr:siderophore biosynthesis protein [Bacteroidaceae bacterium]